MEYGFVYIWYDRKHKRYYIGCHWGPIDDGYVCSSSWMTKAFKRRPNDFKRRILTYVYTNRKDMFEEEMYWHSLIKDVELKTRYYNLQRAKPHWTGEPQKYKSISEKISKSVKEKFEDPEFRQRYDESQKNRDASWTKDEAVLEKKRQSMIKTMAAKFPEEARQRYKTKVGTEEHRESQKELVNRFWKNATKEQKQERSRKISEKLKNSTEVRSNHMKSLKWYNNGSVNVRKQEHPGDGWSYGRLKT